MPARFMVARWRPPSCVTLPPRAACWSTSGRWLPAWPRRTSRSSCWHWNSICLKAGRRLWPPPPRCPQRQTLCPPPRPPAASTARQKPRSAPGPVQRPPGPHTPHRPPARRGAGGPQSPTKKTWHSSSFTPQGTARPHPRCGADRVERPERTRKKLVQKGGCLPPAHTGCDQLALLLWAAAWAASRRPCRRASSRSASWRSRSILASVKAVVMRYSQLTPRNAL